MSEKKADESEYAYTHFWYIIMPEPESFLRVQAARADAWDRRASMKVCVAEANRMFTPPNKVDSSELIGLIDRRNLCR
jgi:hypothetical protein